MSGRHGSEDHGEDGRGAEGVYGEGVEVSGQVESWMDVGFEDVVGLFLEGVYGPPGFCWRFFSLRKGYLTDEMKELCAQEYMRLFGRLHTPQPLLSVKGAYGRKSPPKALRL